jgi:5'(3')-deoxyribonucleotidase
MKGELKLEEFKNKCKQISEIWKDTSFFNNIQIIEKEKKVLQTLAESRKVWKALGLYYTILNNEEQQFYNFYKEVLKENELQELCIQVKKDPKQKALEYLSKFLRNLKDRRKRAKNK